MGLHQFYFQKGIQIVDFSGQQVFKDGQLLHMLTYRETLKKYGHLRKSKTIRLDHFCFVHFFSFSVLYQC